MRFLALLLTVCLGGHTTALATVSQVSGANVAVPTAPISVCAGTLSYTQQATITAPVSGVTPIKSIGASQLRTNLGAYVYQDSTKTDTYVDYFSQIPFVSLGVTVRISSASNPIQVPENLIYVLVDTDGTTYVAYRIIAAVCGSPSSFCLGISKLSGGTVVLVNTPTQRIASIQGMAMDGSSLYVRTRGNGTLGLDAFPFVLKFAKSSLASTGFVQLSANADAGLSFIVYDAQTNRLFTAGGEGTGHIFILNAASFTLTTDAALGIAAGANTSVGYDRRNDHIYVAESNGPTLRQLNGQTGAFITSTGIGALGTVNQLNIIDDPQNASIHYNVNGGAGNALQRFAIPALTAQNVLGGAFRGGFNAANVQNNRIFQSSDLQVQIRSVKTCDTGP